MSRSVTSNTQLSDKKIAILHFFVFFGLYVRILDLSSYKGYFCFTPSPFETNQEDSLWRFDKKSGPSSMCR